MEMQLTGTQLAHREAARIFAASQIAPWADEIDRKQNTPVAVLAAMRNSGYLGAFLPTRWGGGGTDAISYGLITEEIGKVCSSVRSLMTVHNMSAQAIATMGTQAQRQRWLPALAAGEKIIAFALSEPNVGSSAHFIETVAIEGNGEFTLQGTKKWITYGQIADFFLVFAQCDQAPIALVVDRHSEGLEVEPIYDMLGIRGAMLALVRLKGVRVSKENRVGAVGAGINLVANLALDFGRFSVAWGNSGIAQACLEACVSYSRNRHQGGRAIKDYQLIQKQLTDILVNATTARALCYRSTILRQAKDPRAIMETSLAKYHTSRVAIDSATTAVHLHAANGLSGEYSVNRYLRDAMVMRTIEGTDEIHQVTLANYALQRQRPD